MLKKLTHERLPEITTIFSEVIKNMTENGIHQWNEEYPKPELIKQDIEDDSLYGYFENEALLAVITLNDLYSTEYDALQWDFPSEDYLIIHRLAVRPQAQNRGLAQQIMAWAENETLQRGFKAIRLDTYSGNPKNCYFYKKLNYKEVGEIYFRDITIPFICYEKTLSLESV